MDVRQAVTKSSVRGWDIFVGAFVVVLGLFTQTAEPHTLDWAIPLGAVALWYLLAGRRALSTRDTRWAVAYVLGNVALLPWAVCEQPWVAPTQGFILPLVWWLFLPNRRWPVIATVATAVASATGLLLFALTWTDPTTGTHPWSTGVTVIMVVAIPLVILIVGIVAGTFVDQVFRWGQERVDLVEDLRATEGQRIALEREAAVSDERLRLSQEIHDTIAQDLAGLRFLVQRAQRQAEGLEGRGGATDRAVRTSEPIGRTLDMISTAVDSVLAEARELIAATSPVPDSTFKETMERIGHRFAEDSNIVVDSDVTGARLTREAEVVFIRCLQEGLSNVRKHAGVTRVTIDVAAAGGIAAMTLADDGVGFVDDATNVGLPGMAERIEQAGGRFSVASPGPDRGAVVRVEMPLHPASPHEAPDAAAPTASAADSSEEATR